ncbi:MAG TPA: peptide ABC transporter substrate-binding protein [Nevskiaceae bacterium]|nr:peptide ABC transporter substrate-binding protein [Nevskiaceae bacterium]
MINRRAAKLRFRRSVRLKRLQVEELGQFAERNLERNFFRRLERLVEVRRFIASWLLLLVLLGGCVVAQTRALGRYYQLPQPAPGGTYTEGILGAFTNANPVYATSAVDSTVSRLIFAGLFTYNDANQLVGDLATGMDVSGGGMVYTVHLRPNVTWQDGRPLTADDVVFTYQVIQNPDAHSPLQSSWRGVAVAKVDAQTVTFTLRNAISSFPYSLTNGIVPKHLLGGYSMAQLRSVPFNTRAPVGAGPFMWRTIEVKGGSPENRQEQIALSPFANYHAGQPKLNSFVVRAFRNQDQLVHAFQKKEVTAMVGLTGVPGNLTQDSGIDTYSMQLSAQVMTFFRTTQGVLSDSKVRQALVRATDTIAILQQLDYPAQPVREPILKGQPGYNPAYIQPGYDVAAAKALLDANGWTVGANGIRVKDKVRLSFRLYAQDTSEYARVARMLQKQWRAVGVDAQLTLQANTDIQGTLAAHSYDALLYGISVGPDPDVFVYWDSSQADVRSLNRLNFSEWKSPTADVALEAGRTRTDPAIRGVKYQPFLQAWQTETPAVGLYQPRFLYITRVPVYGLSEHAINADAERLTNVHNWMIRTVRASSTE